MFLEKGFILSQQVSRFFYESDFSVNNAASLTNNFIITWLNSINNNRQLVISMFWIGVLRMHRFFRSQNKPLSNLFQAKFHFHYISRISPVVVILNTKLNVILKFPYLCCYVVLITKEFNWQAGEAQCFDREKIWACTLQFKTLK